MFYLDLDFPPAKRRRTTLADNLLTSALNVALVSTALGITAYRMWTGRDGREPEIADKPPPYEEGDWVQTMPSKRSPSPGASTSSTGASNKPNRKRGQPRTYAASRGRKPAFLAPARPPPSSTRDHRPRWELHLDSDDVAMHGGELDDQIDSMSSQLQNLIAEGQKALGREIVVEMDRPHTEDEEIMDDGDCGWNDEVGLDAESGRFDRGCYSAPGSSSGRWRGSRRSSPTKRSRRGYTPDSMAPSPLPHSQQYQEHQLGTSSYQQADNSEGGTQDLRQAMDRVRKAYGLGP